MASSHTKSRSTLHRPDGAWGGLLVASLALSRRLEAEMDHALAIVSLTARGFVALLLIAGDPVPTQADLAHRLALEPSTTSELLGRLARRKLVRRDPARRGGRRCPPRHTGPAVVLTRTGEAVLAEAARIATTVEEDWARRLAIGAGSPFTGMRAYGLRRWLTESTAALRDQGGGV